MVRPTHIQIDAVALNHNLERVKSYAPGKKICAMVKADAYGCGLNAVLPHLDGHVDAFGVACIEEAKALRAQKITTDCFVFQGLFDKDEVHTLVDLRLQCVIHDARQLQWILDTPCATRLNIWVKVNTGMNRLGFQPEIVPSVIQSLRSCPWIDEPLGLITHLACADDPSHPNNALQLYCFTQLSNNYDNIVRSMANSAAIMALPETHTDWVRPGLMLYGVSPFPDKTADDLGLMPVMRFVSAVSAVHHYPPHSPIGYGASWQSDEPSIIGVVAAGYGDGYPRHNSPGTVVWVNGYEAPVVGRVSMDTLTIDLTNAPTTVVGDLVELWGQHIPVSVVAASAGTIAYELLCHVKARGC